MSESEKWPSRRRCFSCQTLRGKLRRQCPRCAEAVCDECYPQAHVAKGCRGVHDRIGESMTLEYDGYWRIAEMLPNGQRHSRGYGQDQAAARVAWDGLKSVPLCRECGHVPWGDWMEPTATEMRHRGLCFSCNNWTNNLTKIDQDAVVVDGTLYSIGETELSIARRCGWPMEGGRLRGDYRHVLGHGGAEFTILFNDGKRTITTNLWSAGPIPLHFRERIPNNATFEERPAFSGYVGVGTATP